MIDDEDISSALPVRLIRFVGVYNLLSLSLLTGVFVCVAIGFGSLVRELDAYRMLLISSAGLLWGWLAGRSSLPARQSFIASAAAGITGIGLLLGRLAAPLFSFVLAMKDLSVRAWLWPVMESYPFLETAAALRVAVEFTAGASTLILRIAQWSLSVMAGRAAFDPLVNAVVWGIALWACAAWAGWFVRRRRQALPAVAPAGILLASTLNYAGGHPILIVLFLGAALFLVVLVDHSARESNWEAQGIDYSLEIRIDLMAWTAPLVLVILAVAAIAPSVSIRRVVDFARTMTENQAARIEQVGEALGLSQERKESLFTPAKMPGGLPRRHLLGSGPELSRNTVMLISTGELPPGPPEISRSGEAPRHYWRSFTFENYTGRGWVNAETDTLSYAAGEQARTLENDYQTGAWISPPGYRPLQQKVQFMQDTGGVIYVSGSLVSVDHDYRVAWRAQPQFFAGEPGGGDMFGGTLESATYVARSILPSVSETDLRSAGVEYPAWITSRYLQLPPELPQRVISLALDLTANASTPYDRALAIESYLRDIPYSLDIPLPPPLTDVVDYYLFSLKEGYCDYAATAMVVLARAAGLPARLVMGYAPGSYDTFTAQYRVAESDAHSWAEVYFPGIGWIEFEPTGNRPGFLRRPDAVEPFGHASASQEFTLPVPATPDWTVYPAAAFGLLGALGVFAAAWIVVDGRSLRAMPPGAAVEKLYGRFYYRGRRMASGIGQPPQTGATPDEFTGLLIGQLAGFPQEKKWQRALQPPVQEMEKLTGLYTQAVYSPRLPGDEERLQAIRAWRRLSWRLWLAGFRRPRQGE